MKKILLLLSSISLSLTAIAQPGILPGILRDSTTFTFDATDSLHHNFGTGDPYMFTIDTTNAHLWRIGKTHKPFFSTGSPDTTFAIMTDTANPYHINSNDWFTLKIKNPPINFILAFVHKYQVLPFRAGGIVEFSRDSGTTWENVVGNCLIDSPSAGSPGIFVENFYGRNDTLQTGEPAFTVTNPNWIHTRLQFFTGLPIRRTSGGPGCMWSGLSNLYVRFRFKSDTTSFPPFDGWIIDSIKIRADEYVGVPIVSNYHTLSISPNPSTSGIFAFPELKSENETRLEITNAMGQVLFTVPYTHHVDLSHYPKGLYLYKAVNSTEYYSGRLVVQ